MSSSAAISRDSTAGIGASALVPFQATWINTAGSSTVTTEATLVGQVLNNGATNWVGCNSGEAYYLLQTSESGAEQRTLADGQIFYVSSGKPPAGYLATEGTGSGAREMTASGSAATGSEDGSMATEPASGSAAASTTPTSPDASSSGSSSSGSSESSSGAADASASASSTPNSSSQLTLSAAIMVACGLLAVSWL